jgi:hypothetical protein
MKLEIDEFEKDIILESLSYRIENDKKIILNNNLKEEIEDLFRKIEDNEYL